MNEKHIQQAQTLDAELVKAAGHIRVLQRLAWPFEAEEVFLSAWRAGRPELPAVRLEPVDHGPAIATLESIAARCDRGHPLSNLIYKTAKSYAAAAHMLAGIGTPEFTRWSIELYGRPDEVYKTQSVTGLDAAEFLLDTTDRLCGGRVVPETESTIPAEQFAGMLRAAIDAFFTDDKVAVQLDPDLSSKAIAGSKRVRLRANAMFSDLDFDQLRNHEAFVHTATMINGQRQPNIACLGLGAPRTTRTQEGIAVLAELMTLSIDIPRLRRIALRVRALALALDGADFIDVFKHFLEAGQSESESFKSAQRLFRGGDVHGRVAFTKDCVYLKGLMEVGTFIRIAMRDNHPAMMNALFAGRMTLGDVVELAPLFESGFLVPAFYIPPWAKDLRTLAAAATYSAFVSRIDLTQVTMQNFVAYEE